MQRTSLKLDVFQEIEEYTSGLGNSDLNNRGITEGYQLW